LEAYININFINFKRVRVSSIAIADVMTFAFGGRRHNAETKF